MMHVIILRYAPSFYEGELIKGTHESVETEINNRKYDYAKGYCKPFSSEFKIMDYRIKKECVPDFLKDLRIINLNPSERVKFFDLFKKGKGNVEHHLKGKLKLVQFLLGFLGRKGFFLEPMSASNKDCEPFFSNTWCYNFFLGVIRDPETEYGEEL